MSNVLNTVYCYYLLVILLNVLIAVLTNMHDTVVRSTERQFSKMFYWDYMYNHANAYYSCIQNCPIILSGVMILVTPLVVASRSKGLNHSLNLMNYLVKLAIPCLAIYYALSLLLLPFSYLRILATIARGKYKSHKTANSVILRHFVSFLLLGPVFLLYKCLVMDLE